MNQHIRTIATRAVGGAAIALTTSLVAFAGSASAATHSYKVKSMTDAVHGSCSTKCSLRDAVIAADKAGGTSTISVPAGTYKLTIAATDSGTTPTDDPSVGDLDIKSGAHITITGAGATKTILNAAHLDRMFAVHSGASLAVNDVTVENGDESDDDPSEYGIEAGSGGAFYNDGSLKINKSILTRNTSYDDGGVIYSDSGASATTVTDSTVTDNVSDDPGPMLYADHGSVSLTGDTVEDNFAYDEGGAVYADDTGKVTISNTKLEYNTADDEGGALYLYDTGPLSISHSTISHNDADDEGGAFYLDETGAVSISHSTISGNTADGDGGAAYLDETGAVNVTDSTLSGNVANDDDGGAFYAYESDRLTISGSTLNNNTGYDGGALYTYDADLSITGSHFTGNSGEYTGAIYLDGSSSTAAENITTSVFTDNQAESDEGGAIYDDYGDLSLTRSTFSKNASADEGGALYYDSGDALSAVNDTFDSNSAGDGGGMYFETDASTGEIVLRNDTIARNVAYDGGGIYEPYEANVIENTIIAQNVGTPHNGASTGSGDCYYPFVYNARNADAGHNLDSDGSCIAGTAAAGDKTANPKLGPLKNNGGPVPTDALLSGSPAIGAADSADCPGTDARGTKRTGKCSIGAYQAAPKKKKKK